ncbi:MAG TPA: 6,7-dimethyl-8-ribityllumazine synthase [Longimicrobiaceae bacterium]
MIEHIGRLQAGDGRFGIVVSRFNESITRRLLEGAHDCLIRHGVPEDRIEAVWVPGAWEIPVALRALVRSGRFSALIALGAVIRGSTPHFDYVAGGVANGVASVGLESGLPVIFGVLTTDTIEQALERAGTKAGNKGWDAALAALEMADLIPRLAGADER